MAVAVGGLITGPLFTGRNEITDVALTLRNRAREDQTLVGGDTQYAYPLNFGDNLQPMRDEMTDGALLLRAQKVNPATGRYDSRNPIYFLTDQAGIPVTGYTIDQKNGWILFNPVAGSSGGIWHPRAEANRDYNFGRRFLLNSVPTGAQNITVSVSEGYTIMVNNFVIEISSSSTAGTTYDIQPFLKQGENQIVVQTKRATAGLGDFKLTAGNIGGVNLTTAAGNWSVSRNSALGIAGRVDFKVYEGGALHKRADRIMSANAVLDSLTGILRAESQYFDSLLSIVK